MMKKLLLIAIALFACHPAHASTAPLRVVVSFSILGDFVKVIGGEHVEVYALVKPNQDAHAYEPTPSDVKRLSNAGLVVVNGLGFEGWLERLTQASDLKENIVVASKGITPLVGQHEEEGAHSHHHEETDPHAWQDVAQAKIYVENIRDALIRKDPEHADTYRKNALQYLKKLDALDAEIKKKIASVPPARRKVITSHDAFGYFSHAYGVAFIAPVGKTTEAEATAGDMAALIKQIRAENIQVLFIENISNTRIIERIKQETGARMGGTLYSDALSDDSAAATTYLDMMRHNVSHILSAMQ